LCETSLDFVSQTARFLACLEAAGDRRKLGGRQQAVKRSLATANACHLGPEFVDFFRRGGTPQHQPTRQVC
jgi:hypothetical protein